jgi:hypothetical protein
VRGVGRGNLSGKDLLWGGWEAAGATSVKRIEKKGQQGQPQRRGPTLRGIAGGRGNTSEKNRVEVPAGATSTAKTYLGGGMGGGWATSVNRTE